MTRAQITVTPPGTVTRTRTGYLVRLEGGPHPVHCTTMRQVERQLVGRQLQARAIVPTAQTTAPSTDTRPHSDRSTSRSPSCDK